MDNNQIESRIELRSRLKLDEKYCAFHKSTDNLLSKSDSWKKNDSWKNNHVPNELIMKFVDNYRQ